MAPEIAPGPQPTYFTEPEGPRPCDRVALVMRWQPFNDQPDREYLLTMAPALEIDDLLKTMREHDAVHLTNGTRCGWRDQYAVLDRENKS